MIWQEGDISQLSSEVASLSSDAKNPIVDKLEQLLAAAAAAADEQTLHSLDL